MCIFIPQTKWESTITEILKMGIVRHKETVHPATGCYPSHGSGDQSSCIKSSASAISTKSPNHSMLNVGRDFWWPRSDSLSRQTEKVGFYTCWQSLQGLLNWCLQKEITTQPTSYHHNHWCTSIFWTETPTDNFHLFKNIFLYSISWH